MQKKNIFDLIESYYLVHFIRHLCRTNTLKPGRTAIRYDKKEPYTAEMLTFIADRTDIVVKKKTGFVLSPRYLHYTRLGFHIDKLVDGYANFDFSNKSRILQLNKPAFARAKENTSLYYDYSILRAVLDKVDGSSMLDLGCGMGNLINGYCDGNKKRSAIGIDNNPGLCKRGNRLLAANGFKDRARIYYGDVLKMDDAIPRQRLDAVDIVVANNFMNELFGGNKERKPVEILLAELKRRFPGRYLIIMDYYGIFGTARRNDPLLQHNYMHDVMQLFSGQGVPPPDYKAWNKHYRRAKCRLLNVFEGTNSGICWFIHVIKM